MNDIERQVHDLAARVRRVEQALGTGPLPEPSLTEPASPPDGTVGYSGSVDLAGPVHWGIRYEAAQTLRLPTESSGAVFAALGHPARLEIVRILLQGNASVSDLQSKGDFGTSGQLYHHLKILTSASVATKLDRNEYGITATHVVPTLVALLCAGDISGSL